MTIIPDRLCIGLKTTAHGGSIFGRYEYAPNCWLFFAPFVYVLYKEAK